MKIFGSHDDATIAQLQRCIDVEEGAVGVLCADGHKGYSQPIGGVVAYRHYTSPSGVGYDIGCGNMAVRTSIKASDLTPQDYEGLADRIAKEVSFGIGRANDDKVDHPVLEAIARAHVPEQRGLAKLAADQLGTVGSGNHYVVYRGGTHIRKQERFDARVLLRFSFCSTNRSPGRTAYAVLGGKRRAHIGQQKEDDMAGQKNGGGYILTPEDLTKLIEQWMADGYHVLTPAIRVSSFAAGYGVSASLIKLNPLVDANGGGTDVYYDRNTMDDDERGLSKIGLDKLAASAGVSWVPAECGRRDPLTIQNLWIYHVTGRYLSFDGSEQIIHGEKEIDYRDGSAQIGGWTRGTTEKVHGWSTARVMQARMNGAERAETGARERAIRTLGIKHTYAVAELAKPFVTLRVVAVPDMSDPEIRRLVTARALSGASALYANTSSRQAQALPEAVRHEPIAAPVREREPEPVGRGRAPEQQRQEPRRVAESEPDHDEDVDKETGEVRQAEAKMPAGAVHIRKVAKEQKTYSASHAKAGQTFTKWHVRFEGDDREYTTAYGKVGSVVDELYADKTALVVFSWQENRFNENEITSIKRAVPEVPAPSIASMKL